MIYPLHNPKHLPPEKWVYSITETEYMLEYTFQYLSKHRPIAANTVTD